MSEALVEVIPSGLFCVQNDVNKFLLKNGWVYLVGSKGLEVFVKNGEVAHPYVSRVKEQAGNHNFPVPQAHGVGEDFEPIPREMAVKQYIAIFIQFHQKQRFKRAFDFGAHDENFAGIVDFDGVKQEPFTIVNIVFAQTSSPQASNLAK